MLKKQPGCSLLIDLCLTELKSKRKPVFYSPPHGDEELNRLFWAKVEETDWRPGFTVFWRREVQQQLQTISLSRTLCKRVKKSLCVCSYFKAHLIRYLELLLVASIQVGLSCDSFPFGWNQKQSHCFRWRWKIIYTLVMLLIYFLPLSLGPVTPRTWCYFAEMSLLAWGWMSPRLMTPTAATGWQKGTSWCTCKGGEAMAPRFTANTDAVIINLTAARQT